MKIAARLALACGASLAAAAFALDTPTWPPPAEVGARIRELQLVIIDRESTAPQRETARAELASLLKSPAGQARGPTPDEKPVRPARAAIDPFPSVAPAGPAFAAPPAAQPGVARIEVIEPPRRLANPLTGSVPAPTGRFAIDPRTGSVLHEIPGGYIDPRTGQVTPR